MQNNWYNGILSCKTKGTIAIGNMKGNIVKQIKFRYQVDKSYIALGFFYELQTGDWGLWNMLYNWLVSYKIYSATEWKLESKL